MITRRAFLGGLALSIATAPLAADAQQPTKVPRIGYLGPASSSSTQILNEAFRQGLRELGYVEGKNIVFDYRWAEGKAERLPGLAAELVSLKPDVIFASSPQGVLALKNATATIPIVFAGVGDPVGLGIVASLARPGGNVTGMTNFGRAASRKRLELLKESVPRISSVAVLWNTMSPGHAIALEETEAAAKFLRVKLLALGVAGPDDFERVFKAAASARPQALITLPDPLMNDHVKRIVDFTAANRLPAIYARSEFVDAGGLMSYGPDLQATFRRAATYVDKILRGAKPADLPVEEPTKLVLAVNLKTAKALGIKFPQTILVRADRVIE